MMDDGTTVEELVFPIAAGLAGRLRSLVIALDRLDRLESGSGDWRNHFITGELSEAATAFTLRALRTAADPLNFTILKALVSDESHTIDHLLEVAGVGRLVLSERLNDLVQVGLVLRLIDTDQAQATASGAAMVQLLDEIRSAVIAQYMAQMGH